MRDTEQLHMVLGDEWTKAVDEKIKALGDKEAVKSIKVEDIDFTKKAKMTLKEL